MIKYLSTFIILTVLGILYEKYKNKYMNDDELNKYDLINKFLLNGSEDSNKPILWVYNPNNRNSRNWGSFYSRSNDEINQPYISLCLETIVKHCGGSFKICLIDNDSFIKLMPKWNIILNRLANPIKEHVRSLAMANLLYKYGGMCLPISTIVLKDLYPLYNQGIKTNDCFVGETINRNRTSSNLGYFVNKNIMGSLKGSRVIENFIHKLEILNSKDYTNEMDFCGHMNMILYNGVQGGVMSVITGKHLGITSECNKQVLLDDLLADTFINFDCNVSCIVIDNNELLSRTKYGWFNRLSREQVLKARTMISKQLLVALSR